MMKEQFEAKSCRICLTTTKKLRSLYKPMDEVHEPPNEMLEKITGIQVEKFDEHVMLPKHICKNCEFSLSMAFEFRVNALKTQQMIVSFLKELIGAETLGENTKTTTHLKFKKDLAEFEMNIQPMDSVVDVLDEYLNDCCLRVLAVVLEEAEIVKTEPSHEYVLINKEEIESDNDNDGDYDNKNSTVHQYDVDEGAEDEERIEDEQDEYEDGDLNGMEWLEFQDIKVDADEKKIFTKPFANISKSFLMVEKQQNEELKQRIEDKREDGDLNGMKSLEFQHIKVDTDKKNICIKPFANISKSFLMVEEKQNEELKERIEDEREDGDLNGMESLEFQDIKVDTDETKTCTKSFGNISKSFLMVEEQQNEELKERIEDEREDGDLNGMESLEFQDIKLDTDETNTCTKPFANISKSFLMVEEQQKNKELKARQATNIKQVPLKYRKLFKNLSPICDVCGRIFARRCYMLLHRRRRHEEPKYSCELCDQKFQMRELLRKHMYSHSGGKPYKCEFCSRTFYYEHDQKLHEAKVHQGHKPYICEVCGKAFGYAICLKTHKLVHAEFKSYRCEYCNRNFRFQNNLKQHKLTRRHQNAVRVAELGVLPSCKFYRCEYCNKNFRDKYDMKKHELTRIHQNAVCKAEVGDISICKNGTGDCNPDQDVMSEEITEDQ